MTTDKGLMVWLPLTDANHCENQGLVGKLTCTTTPTFVDGGKLGKCLSTGAYQMSAEQTTKVFNNNHLTIAFWVYIDAATGASTPRSVFIGNDGMNANNNRKFMIMQFPTVNDLHYSWMNDAASNTFIVNIINGVLPSYKWTHVAITYENPIAIIYINGVEVKRDTGVSNSSTFAYTTPIIGNNTGRRINDFRIYSYALSPQEIKELSRGKIGHYPCNTNDCSKVLWGDPTQRITVANDHPNYRIVQLQGGKTYTLRFQAKSSAAKNDNGMLLLQYCKTATSGRTDYYNTWVYVNTTTNYQFYETTFTTPSDHPYFILGRRSDTNTVGGISTTIKNVIIMSPPAFLSDISGNHYDLDINGNVILNASTPRYDKSIKLIGNDTSSTSYLHRPYFDFLQQVTMSCWVKQVGRSTVQATNTTTSMHIMGQGRDYENYGFVICSDNGVPCLKCGAGTKNASGGIVSHGYNISSGVTMALDTWHHIAATYDGTNAKIYVDGVLKATQAVPSPLPWHQCSNRFVIGKMAYYYSNTDKYHAFDGNISDARVYATALSADDVKELYSLGHY